MAKLKRLTLKHFKSFKSAVIPISEGFTAIMGPNGSGKSNIIDALIFVLGEGRLKIVRANRLKDLVNVRTKSEEALVSLDIEHEGKEYTITRTINKKGQSVYKINGKRSTKHEIVSLLSSMGISQKGYNFVLQGEVTRLIRMTPQERRGIIDEIAGVSDYEEKKEEALKKLEAVADRIKEVSILLGEREEQLRKLEKDKDDALRYKELQKRVKDLKKTLLKREIDELENRLAHLKREKEELLGEKEEIEERIDEIERDLRKLEEELGQVTEQITSLYGGDKSKSYYEVTSQIETLQKEKETLEENIRGYEAETSTLSERLNEIERELALLQKDLEDIYERRKKKAEEVNEIRKIILQIEETIRREESEIIPLKTRLEEIEREIQQLREKYSILKEEYGKVVGEYNTLLESVEKKRRKREEKQKRMEQLRKELSDLEKRKEELFNEEKRLNNELISLREEMDKIREELAELKGISTALRNMGVSTELVETLLRAQERGELRGIKGYVASLIRYDPRYRKALEAAAGRRLFYIVVETFQDAIEAVKFLKREGLGRATFIPLDRVKPNVVDVPPGEGIIGRALDLVDFDHTLKRAMEYVFGDTLVVDSIERTKTLKDYRVATLDGDIVERSGVLTGGSSKGVSLLKVFEAEQKRQRLRELESEINSITQRLSQIREEYSSLNSRIGRISAELEGFEEEEEEEVRLEELRRNIEEKERELTNIVNKISDLEQEKSLISRKIRKIERGDLFEEYSRRRREHEALIKELNEYDLLIREKKQKIEILENERMNIQERMQKLQKEREEGIKRLEELKKEIEELEEKKRELEEKMKKHQEEVNLLIKKREEIEEKIKELSRELGILREKRSDVEKRLISVESGLSSLKTRLNDLRAEFSTMEGNVLDSLPPNPEEEMNRLIEEMRSLEPVNMRAIEEYEHMKALVEEVKERVEKLERERKAVLKLIEEIEKKKREVFMNTFNALSKKFSEVYRELTGGTARIRLTDDDIDKAGLIIEATPKGKTPVSMDALSGGEKAMVALSFIFSTALFRPSPFYVLDEPDLMLDKVNAERMAKYIKRLSKNAQFILVSHRDVVLKEADQIIGVYLGKDGSSLIEVRVPSSQGS